MLTINQVTLCGNLAGDVEIRTLGDGRRVANLRIVTDDGYKGEGGDWVKRPNFHRVSCFIQSVVDYLEDNGKKGTPFMVQGAIMNRKYVDSAGVEKWSTEIAATLINNLGNRPKTEAPAEEQPKSAGRSRQRKAAETQGFSADLDDEVPF